MLIYSFSHGDLMRTRFAISPLNELIQSIAALSDPASGSLHLPWIRAVRPRVANMDLAPLQALARIRPGSYQPDFIAPPPQTPLPDVHAEIERIRRTPAGQVRRELREAYPDGGLPTALEPLQARPQRAVRAIADLIAAYWECALEPHWEAIRETLEDDIAYRARLLTTGGAVEIFDDLHPEIRWRDGKIEVERAYEQTVDLAGRGLMLVPSVFIWPRSGALWDPPWQPALIYPARGVANLWAPTRRDPQALADLIGARRAAILAGLDRGASTTTVARRLRASPASISENLAVLRRAGLVRARRQGREVLYTRTTAADTLLRAAP